MKVLFVWTGVTSYMADCWCELAKKSGVELKVIIERHSSGSEIDVAKTLAGFDVQVVSAASEISLDDWVPDVIFAVGWHSKTVRAIVANSKLKTINPKLKQVCCFDMPWRWQPRCIAARWVLHRFLNNYDAAFVPGERAARYAHWLGFKQIQKGLFSLDTCRFANEPGKQGFMFIGRNAPEKRIDIIKAAYELYKQKGGKWALDIYGGSNFVQPSEVPNLYRNHACLLLASSFDPWPLVMLEATSVGLMVIASDRCGNVGELGAKAVPFGNARAMADAMLEAEKSNIKPAGRERAAQYDSRVWADHVVAICNELLGDKVCCSES